MSLAEFFSVTTENWSPQMKQRRNKDSDYALVQGEEPSRLRSSTVPFLFHFIGSFILQDLEKHITQARASNPTQDYGSLCQSLTKYLTFKHKQI